MSDLIESEATNYPAYRRFRSEYRGKRWLYQTFLRDHHGHIKTSVSVPTDDSPELPYKEQRKEMCETRRANRLKSRSDHKSAVAQSRNEALKGLENETVAFCLKKSKSPPNNRQKEFREQQIRKEIAEMMYKKERQAAWKSTQPQQLLRTLRADLGV